MTMMMLISYENNEDGSSSSSSSSTFSFFTISTLLSNSLNTKEQDIDETDEIPYENEKQINDLDENTDCRQE